MTDPSGNTPSDPEGRTPSFGEQSLHGAHAYDPGAVDVPGQAAPQPPYGPYLGAPQPFEPGQAAGGQPQPPYGAYNPYGTQPAPSYPAQPSQTYPAQYGGAAQQRLPGQNGPGPYGQTQYGPGPYGQTQYGPGQNGPGQNGPGPYGAGPYGTYPPQAYGYGAASTQPGYPAPDRPGILGLVGLVLVAVAGVAADILGYLVGTLTGQLALIVRSTGSSTIDASDPRVQALIQQNSWFGLVPIVFLVGLLGFAVSIVAVASRRGRRYGLWGIALGVALPIIALVLWVVSAAAYLGG